MELACEVVRVLDEHSLINSESYQCTYDTGYGEALTPGFYVVIWEMPAEPVRYDDTGRFFGPFTSRTEAEAFVRQATHRSVGGMRPAQLSATLH